MTSYQQKQRTKAQKKARLEAFVEMQKARKGAKIARINSKTRTGAKPKSTGITQSVGEVIKSNYSVGAPQMEMIIMAELRIKLAMLVLEVF